MEDKGMKFYTDKDAIQVHKDNGIKKSRKVGVNEIVRVGNSIHTFSNETDREVEFVVFRFVPDHVDKKEIIKNDKVNVAK